ncbi:MAG: hypothetical protein HKN15_07860 [Xanthomonadales bacterium]|nr:hypothetical protein [Xanthomonadales bacterium]
MKWTKLLLLNLVFWPGPALWANFSDSLVTLHPPFPVSAPFIIEIAGTWPSDCHPGEQKPVVRSFDGQTVQIEFEIIVFHVVCNDVATDYRVLVDMNEAVQATPPVADTLDILVEFQGATLTWKARLSCRPEIDCAGPRMAKLPERGLFTTPERKDEGLLVARQNDVTVVYPLVYDETGRGEWLISVGQVDTGSFFSELFRSSGGDCFDCEASNPQTELTSAGHISVLVDDPGTLQVKVNDRLFLPYTKMVYGYKGPLAGPLRADLGGRWALRENQGTDPPLGDITALIPPAFDITMQSISPGDPVQATYLVTTVTGEELGQVVCGSLDKGGKPLDHCEFIDETDQLEPLFRVYPEGPSSLALEYGRAVIAVGIPPRGKAVRLD